MKTVTKTATKTLPPVQVAPKQTCPGDKATMNCVLQDQSPAPATAKTLTKSVAPTTGTVTTPPATSTTTSTTTELAFRPALQSFSLAATVKSTYGVDFGWSSMSAIGARAIGAKFGASYLSTDASKNWTRALVDSYHALGLKTVAVWETSATRAEQGYSAGVADAIAARGQAAALGNTDRPIDFAVDCDCAGSSILGYFQGVHHVLGDRGNAYGGYDQVLYLSQHGVVGHENWQTYAWSNGRWLPASIAPLEQYLNGNAFDNDRAIASAYGQWPYTAPKPVDQRHYDWLPGTRRAIKVKAFSPAWGAPRVVHARESSVVRWLDKHGCSPTRKRPHRFVRRGCIEHAQHARLLDRRLWFIAHHTPNLKHKATKPRWGARHYKAKGGHVTTLGGAYGQIRRRLVPHKPITRW